MKQAWLTLLAGCVLAYGQDVMKTLHGIEEHYNNAKTLQVKFTETRIDSTGKHKPQAGTLYLRKPRQMRWEYTSPPGDLFISDGKFTYDYIAKSNSGEQGTLKEDYDQRGPLAFLLGKLDFNRDFGEFQTGDPDGAIKAVSKSDKLDFSDVTLVPGPNSSIKKLSLRWQDGSTIQFVFEDEKLNQPLPDSLFRFVKPPGAVMVDSTRGKK
jgi:outer membrane lipoprotein carrier protein